MPRMEISTFSRIRNVVESPHINEHPGLSESQLEEITL